MLCNMKQNAFLGFPRKVRITSYNGVNTTITKCNMGKQRLVNFWYHSIHNKGHYHFRLKLFKLNWNTVFCGLISRNKTSKQGKLFHKTLFQMYIQVQKNKNSILHIIFEHTKFYPTNIEQFFFKKKEIKNCIRICLLLITMKLY